MIKLGAVVVKDWSVIRCCKESFATLVIKVAPECKEEEKVVRIVICATKKFVDAHKVLSNPSVSIFVNSAA